MIRVNFQATVFLAYRWLARAIFGHLMR